MQEQNLKISFHFISKESVELTRSILENHFNDVLTLPGTRLFHSFQPMDHSGNVEARRISKNDKANCIVFNLLNNQQHSQLVELEDLIPGCFSACAYDSLWYFGMVYEVNPEEKDVTVKFLHPNRLSPSFS